MKKLLLILLASVSILNAQALELIYDGVTPKWAIDVATDEYGYDSSVNGLDLNGSEMITTTADRDFSGAGHWTGMTVSGGVGTFTTTASLTNSNFTHFVSGHNYTIQGDFKSGASSSFKIVTDNDSTTITTTTTSATKAFTFTYSGGSQTVQFKGVGTDTWTGDNISITEAYNLEVDGWFKPNYTSGQMYIWFLGNYTTGLRLYLDNTNCKLGILGKSFSIRELALSFLNNVWNSFSCSYSPFGELSSFKLNDNTITATGFTQIGKYPTSNMVAIHIGSSESGTSLFFNGQIGKIKITRKDGTGAVVSTSIYDWKGASATFLNDKGTNGNNLTGVNVTTADQVKYSGGKYK